MNKSKSWSARIIWVILIVTIAVNILNTRKIRPDKVFIWDIKSYYAYLPAGIIHGDLHLDFLKNEDSKYNDYFWPSQLENGNKLIVTSMGLSMLYSPFFILAHGIASISAFEANGYSPPYAFALIYSILFYVFIGLFFLRKVLLHFFSEFTASLTILLIYFSTNLLYYSIYIPMTHAYNFALISVFIWYTIRWHDSQKIKHILFLGLLYGFISLVRPTNALIILFFILYNVYSFKQLRHKVLLFLSNWKQIVLMIIMTFLVWLPQMLYWKEITGHYFYYSYGVKQASFFWDNPQLFNAVLSFRKGWLVYTPIMVIAIGGIWYLFRKYKKLVVPVLLITTLFIYVQSSWWSWWFGGGYGNRAFVDLYGLLAIPLAAVIEHVREEKRLIRSFAFTILGLLFLLNVWNIVKYNHVSIHYYWNSRLSYMENLFHIKPNGRYWRTIPYPDYEKARKGMYVAQNLIERYEGPYDISPEIILEQIKTTISTDNKQVSYYTNEFGINKDSAIEIVSRNIYELNYSIEKYIEPIEQQLKRARDEKYLPFQRQIEKEYNIDRKDIDLRLYHPIQSMYVISDNNLTHSLLNNYYNSNFIDSLDNLKLYEIKGLKDYCVVTDDMENKKWKRKPVTCNLDYNIILPSRVFEDCFTGDWAAEVGNTIDKSIRITLQNSGQEYVYITLWKKGAAELEITGKSIDKNVEVKYRKARIKGHWKKEEILIALNRNSTQPISLVINSKNDEKINIDDLTIFLLENTN